jgi:hypothetical protein
MDRPPRARPELLVERRRSFSFANDEHYNDDELRYRKHGRASCGEKPA